MFKIFQNLYNQYLRLKLLHLLLLPSLVATAFVNKNTLNKISINLNDSLESIKICKWKNSAKTCVNFSFDDGLPSFRRISQLFDLCNFKASFFIIGTTMQIDSIKDIYARGHEISNHSYSHPIFENLDSINIEYQIRKGKELLENAIGSKCTCFGEPGNFRSQVCKKIAFKYHLFVRHYSEYDDVKRIELDLQQKNLSLVIPTLQMAISTGNIVEYVAHSINGEGFSPINEDLLLQQLKFIKNYENNGDIWVTTVSEGFCYENLFHEISLIKTLTGDTLKLNFLNYNYEKYKDLSTSLLSVEIPFSIAQDICCLTDFTEIKKMSDKFVINIDLKRDTTLILILNNPKINIVSPFLKDKKITSQTFEKNTDSSISKDIFTNYELFICEKNAIFFRT